MNITLRPQWDVGPPGGARVDTAALLALLAGVQETGNWLPGRPLAAGRGTVSYTHLTLPTSDLV